MTKTTHRIKNSRRQTRDSFSVFFRTASKSQKTEIFIQAAKKANKDQQKLVKHANLKLKKA